MPGGATSDLAAAAPTLPLPALTLWQPWASLLVTRVKVHETRSWPAPRRLVGGRIAIHAAASHPARRHVGPKLDAICRTTFGDDWRAVLPLGAVLATAILEGSVPTDALRSTTSASDLACGIWDDGRWAWTLSSIQVLVEPSPAKGGQGIWTWRR